MRTINIPTIVKLTDLEARLGPEKARKVFENIWLAEHPGAERVLRKPLTAEQLDIAEEYANGQIKVGQVSSALFVLRKAFLLDEWFKDRFLVFIADERASLNGGEVISEMKPRRKRRVTPKALKSMRANIAKGRAIRAARLKNGQ